MGAMALPVSHRAQGRSCRRNRCRGAPRGVSARLCGHFPPCRHPMSPPSLKTRERLSEVRYEIRGELARRARELEAQGRSLIKLNIGNPGAFGFRAPEHLQRAIADRIADTDPYTHQQGLPAAREAIAAFHKTRGTPERIARARVRRQRRQRTDRPVAARAAQSRRRSAAALARLSAVVGGDHPQRRPPGLLPLQGRRTASCPIPTRSRRWCRRARARSC